MQNHTESESFTWFDELSAGQAHVDNTRPSSPSIYALQRFVPADASVVIRPVPKPEPRRRRVSVWALALAALAGASTFVLGATLVSML
jgi:hypothetical protein